MGKINSVKTTIDGHEFDSLTEGEFYKHLKKMPNIEEIEIQPKFTLLEPFEIECGRCDNGKVESPKTGKLINCKPCNGTGKRNRQAWTYTADFRYSFKDSYVEYVADVKGFANERFPLVRKMFEHTLGYELLVVKKTKNGWKYV